MINDAIKVLKQKWQSRHFSLNLQFQISLFLMKEQICFCNANTCLPDRRIKCTSKLFDKKKKTFDKNFSFGQQFFSSFTRCRQNNDFREIKLIFLGGGDKYEKQPASQFLLEVIRVLIALCNSSIDQMSFSPFGQLKEERETHRQSCCLLKQTNSPTEKKHSDNPVEVKRLTDREETSQQCTNQIASYCCALQSQSQSTIFQCNLCPIILQQMTRHLLNYFFLNFHRVLWCKVTFGDCDCYFQFDNKVSVQKKIALHLIVIFISIVILLKLKLVLMIGLRCFLDIFF